MCEHLGRCSVPSAYNTSAGSAAHSHHDLNERMRRGQGNWISRPPDLNRGNGKHQSDRNQATGRKLQVGQLDSRTGLGCLTPPPMNRYRSTRKARKKCRKMPNPVKIVEPMKQRTWNTKTGRKCQSPHKNGESNGWCQSDRAALCMTLPPPKKIKDKG